MIHYYNSFFARIVFLAMLLLGSGNASFAQIYAPEGINMPGDWNGWTNPPAAGSAFGSEFQVSGGGVKRIVNGTTRWWKTTFTGTTGGQFLFTSGSSGNPWGNKWNETTVAMNTLQNYAFNGGGSNNSITCNASKFYTSIWEEKDVDNGGPNDFDGYTSTRAIFMETSATPISVSATSQSPLASNVTPSDVVTVSITLSAAKSGEEIVYLRYSTDNYVTSTMVTAAGSGTSYTADIPAQADGSTVQYYAITSTVSSISADYDLYSLSKSANRSYTSTALPLVNISFRVDMQNELVSGSGVFVAGSFNGFNSTANPLTLISGTTYGTTIAMAQGSTIEFKFINGSSWENGLSGSCVNGSGNRVYTVGSSDATIASTCFAKCNACVAKVATTFRVNMNGLTVNPSGMSIAGDFGSTYPQWAPGSIILFNEGNGIWATTLQLVPGQVVPFKFINGNAWGQDEGVPGACSVGGNRSYTVPPGVSSTPLVCFGTCGTCITVTLQVDMTGQTVGANGVHVAGAFQGWNPATTELTNIGGNIYARTVLVDPNQVSDYKFVNGNSWGNDESVANVCSPGSNGNRNFVMGNSSKTLPVVCFRQCLGCNDASSWRGVNSNFADGNNWTSGAAPTAGCRPVVISNTANNPQISTGAFSIGNLTLTGGTGIGVASGASLNICGNISANNGTFSGDGNITLSGSSAQTISGILNTSGSGNFVIDNFSGVSLSSGAIVKINNGLKLGDGNFNVTAGTLTIGSSATSQGRILKAEAGGSLTGQITYEKYLNGLGASATGSWYYVSPTTSNFALGSFDQGGNNLHPSTFLPSNPDPASLYFYSNNGGAFDDFGWAKGSSASQTANAGEGFRVWARKATSNSQFKYSGSPIGGNVNFPISYCATGCSYLANGATNGWNLLGNSYPCPIDWNAASGWTKSGISGNAIYIWNASTESYSTYNGTVGLNGGSRYIAGGQAFFVNAASGAASLSMNEDVKFDIYTSGLRVASEEISGLKITAISDNRQDEAFLDMTPGNETSSATKLDNPGITLSLGTQNRFSIASPAIVEEANLIPLNLRRAGNSFSINFEKSGPQSAFQNIYLKDETNGQLFPIGDNTSSFDFISTGNDASRFSLVISDAATSVSGKISSAISVYPNPSNGKITLRNSNATKGGFSVSDLSGKIILRGELTGVNQIMDVQTLPAGQFLIRFEQSPEVIRFSKL